MADVPPYLSHSALSQYLRCSEQYRLERVEKIPTPPAWYFIGGRAVHLATQWMDERNEYPYSEDQLAYLWSQAYDKEIGESFEEWPEDEEWLRVGRRGQEQGYLYWDMKGLLCVKAWQEWRMSPEGSLELVGIEREIELPLPSGITLKGYIDRIFADTDGESVHVLDLKTSTKRPASPLQLGFYKVGLELGFAKEFGVPHFDGFVKSGSYWMAKDAKAFPQKIKHFTVDVIDRYAQKFFKGVQGDVFLPNLGDACFFCAVKDHCFAYNGD